MNRGTLLLLLKLLKSIQAPHSPQIIDQPKLTSSHATTDYSIIICTLQYWILYSLIAFSSNRLSSFTRGASLFHIGSVLSCSLLDSLSPLNPQKISRSDRVFLFFLKYNLISRSSIFSLFPRYTLHFCRLPTSFCHTYLCCICYTSAYKPTFKVGNNALTFYLT